MKLKYYWEGAVFYLGVTYLNYSRISSPYLLIMWSFEMIVKWVKCYVTLLTYYCDVVHDTKRRFKLALEVHVGMFMMINTNVNCVCTWVHIFPFKTPLQCSIIEQFAVSKVWIHKSLSCHLLKLVKNRLAAECQG